MYEVGVRAIGRPRYRCEGTVETKLNIGYVGMDCSNVAQIMFRWRNNWGGGTRWRGWLKHCATSQKVSGSIPDGVIGIFQ